MTFDRDKYTEYEKQYYKHSDLKDCADLWEFNQLYCGDVLPNSGKFGFFMDFYWALTEQFVDRDSFAESNACAEQYYEFLQHLLKNYLSLNLSGMRDLLRSIKSQIDNKRMEVKPVTVQIPQKPNKSDFVKRDLPSFDEYKKEMREKWIASSLQAAEKEYTKHKYLYKLWKQAGKETQSSGIEAWFSGIPKSKLDRAKRIKSLKEFLNEVENDPAITHQYERFMNYLKDEIVKDVHERMADENKFKQEYQHLQWLYNSSVKGYENAISKYEKELSEHNKDKERFNGELRLLDSYSKLISKTANLAMEFKEHDKIINEELGSPDYTREAFVFDSLLSLLPLPDFYSQAPFFDKYNNRIETKIKPGLQFDKDSGVLAINYFLPSIDDIPTEKKLVASSGKVKIQYHTDTFVKKLYNTLVYEIALIIIDFLFKIYKSANTVVFNGYVKTLDKSDGDYVSPCIMSVYVNRDQWYKINLYNVEARACFKSLKGISVVNIETATPIVPILTFDTNDRKFVEGYSVETNAGTNLASMDWKDFENLVRELFEWEFSKNGGEVKITQASRDGGVDAVIFDPDPIRGGKIIVQAKRYTNTVDVSAVRDLYGTVIDNGANKGIMITTSDYGSDSYNFVKDKPVTLLNGGQLLGLLEKHGKQAYINIQEAKKHLQ